MLEIDLKTNITKLAAIERNLPIIAYTNNNTSQLIVAIQIRDYLL